MHTSYRFLFLLKSVSFEKMCQAYRRYSYFYLSQFRRISNRMRTAQEVLTSGAGAAVTDTIFNPLEVVKVRLQLQLAREAPPESMAAAARSLWRVGGLSALWLPGLAPTWARSFCFTGLRVGLYPSTRDLVAQVRGEPAGSTSVAVKVLAGATTGAIGSAIANPVDLVRTRMQAQAGREKIYSSSLAAAQKVLSQGGVVALWRGVSATALRAALLSGAQLASYDQTKQARLLACMACVVPHR